MVLEKVPSIYYSAEELEVFSKVQSDTLPELRAGVDYEIKLLEGY